MAKLSSSNGLEKRPKLRFPGFDEPYKQCRIGDIYAERSRRGASDMELLSVTMNDGVKPRSEIEGKDNSSEDKSNYKIVRKGDMVYNSMRMWQGANGISPCDGIVSPAYTVLMPKQEINNGYFAALFKSANLINEFRKNSQGMTSDTWNLKYPQIETIKVQVPSVSEQDKVSELFGVLDARIVAQAQLIEALKKYKRGVNNQILSQIDNSYNCRLGSVCEIVGGGTPDTLHTEYWGNTVEWFTPSEIGKTKYVNNSVRKLSDIGLDNSSAKLLPIGTVLLTTRATLGEMSIAKRECSTNQGFQSLIPHTDRVSSEYLYYMQIIIKPWCEKYASGNTFREISKSALSDCIIPIPDRARQEQIVKLLSSIDMLIGAAESISMSLSKIRHGLMQQLFI